MDVPISPHNAMGPLQVLAGAHAMLTVPNFYRLEYNVANIPNCQKFLDRPIQFGSGELRLSDRPGLGVDLDVERLRAHTMYARP